VQFLIWTNNRKNYALPPHPQEVLAYSEIKGVAASKNIHMLKTTTITVSSLSSVL
jgi:hypothetical protein